MGLRGVRGESERRERELGVLMGKGWEGEGGVQVCVCEWEGCW